MSESDIRSLRERALKCEAIDRYLKRNEVETKQNVGRQMGFSESRNPKKERKRLAETLSNA